MRTADCVVGGFRYESSRKLVGSLLLGLYDDEGLLHPDPKDEVTWSKRRKGTPRTADGTHDFNRADHPSKRRMKTARIISSAEEDAFAVRKRLGLSRRISAAARAG